MKKLLLLIVVLFTGAFSSCICEGYDPLPLTFRYVNRTDEELVVVVGYRDARNDTTIYIDNESGELATIMELIGTVPPMDLTTQELDVYNDNYGYADYVRRKYNGLMHVFFAKSADVDMYGWKGVAERNLVVQRYDLRGEDIKKFEGGIAFPPSPSMVNVSMWPPYGTYINNTIE